jgi:hypothetical protein
MPRHRRPSYIIGLPASPTPDTPLTRRPHPRAQPRLRVSVSGGRALRRSSSSEFASPPASRGWAAAGLIGARHRRPANAPAPASPALAGGLLSGASGCTSSRRHLPPKLVLPPSSELVLPPSSAVAPPSSSSMRVCRYSAGPLRVCNEWMGLVRVQC